ncbi:hypothetical protein [Polyangium jinanense]|uniref:Uncharacterized protein n=1 Tax=Polyangium jinanense TaxID=2829994 RepID=A0A9X3XE80_9BACT|nr:hypothetical protein [Polyangium jinanense]MDC3961877.1 hypothetical protein [Polyangium jinanense]MDC3987805.1 hypothetical protein [Polyangium jinanense]
MAHVPIAPFTGKLLIDANAAKEIIFDLAPGAGRMLKRAQEGLEDVLLEVPSALTKYAATLGVSLDLIGRIATSTANVKLLNELLGDARKLVEVLEESIAYHEDQREAEFSQLAETVKRTVARKDPSVEAAFEKLLKYVAQVGVKAAATRRKNEAAAAAKTPAADGT